MDEEIKKIKKKETIMTCILILLLLIVIFIIIFVFANKDNNIVSEQPPIIDENNYIRLEDVVNENYQAIYKSVNLKKVTFINIQEVLVSNFYSKQEEIINTINDNITENKDFIDKYNIDNNITDYTVNSKIDSNVLYEYKDNILSLLYLVEDSVDYIGLTNHITNIFIDVSGGQILNNDAILEKYSLTKENICNQAFNRVVNEHDGNFVDKDTKEELTKEDILNNQDKYIKTLVDNFDTYIYPYLNQESLYFKFNKNDISNFLFNEDEETIQYSTLKI